MRTNPQRRKAASGSPHSLVTDPMPDHESTRGITLEELNFREQQAYAKGVQDERRRLFAYLKEDNERYVRYEHTLTVIRMEIYGVLQAVTTGTQANSNPAIARSLEGKSGVLKKALADHKEACLHADLPFEGIEAFVQTLDPLIVSAAGGDCEPIKRYIEQNKPFDFEPELVAAKTVARPGRPKGKTGMRPDNRVLGALAESLKQQYPKERWVTLAGRAIGKLSAYSKNTPEWEAAHGLEIRDSSAQGNYLKTQYYRYRKT